MTAYDSATPLDVLRRVTRRMTATANVHEVLDSIVRAFVEHAAMDTARIWLHTTEAECEYCRTHGPTGHYRGRAERTLHLCATEAGVVQTGEADIGGFYHQLPVGVALPGHTAALRRPFHCVDVMSDPRVTGDALAREFYGRHGFHAFVGYPLEFRGELLGVLGGLSRRAIPAERFEHLEIFAAQAAMAIEMSRMLAALERSAERLRVENDYLQEEIRSERGFEEVIGSSPALRSVLRQVKQVAGTDSTVLLLGETGTGKELVARAIHALSARRERPLIKVNCAAISPSLVESELFGHEKGAFTGALQRRLGRFELANRGTLFLDEIGELALDVQVKLLRVLQEQEFERVGGSQAIRTDARLVAATNRDIEREVAAGRFRPDLYYRLNVFPVRIPPLRERVGDIPVLAEHFLRQLQRKLGKPLRGVTPEGLERLTRYRWPGNVRELQNVVERASVLASSPVVDVPPALLPATGSATVGAGDAVRAGDAPGISTLADAERAHILRALRATGGVVHGAGGAAALLDIHPNTLRSRMERLGVDWRAVR